MSNETTTQLNVFNKLIELLRNEEPFIDKTVKGARMHVKNIDISVLNKTDKLPRFIHVYKNGKFVNPGLLDKVDYKTSLIKISISAMTSIHKKPMLKTCMLVLHELKDKLCIGVQVNKGKSKSFMLSPAIGGDYDIDQIVPVDVFGIELEINTEDEISDPNTIGRIAEHPDIPTDELKELICNSVYSTLNYIKKYSDI